MSAFIFGKTPDARRHAVAFKAFNAERANGHPSEPGSTQR